MICSNCGTENPAGQKFCSECGTLLAMPCPTCGATNAPTSKFCGECGTSLGGAPAAAPPTVREAPAAERRLVSVLFADLVGFTTLSEARDPEEVRELLTRYFDAARTLIQRYGGTVEKFIGDAVMAVWGTPVAKEDDAERAVRAALDLTAAVSALGQDVDAPELKARAGVLTGEAAVTIGAEGQGMVAGDMVNTASRIQSAAQPGSVFVGETTRRTTERAIAYEDAGTFELKGKAEPVPLWRAVRVVALIGGALKSTGMEAPFVGRDRELRLIKEMFHASAEERKAHLVSVIGIAGIGKSRLSWEFFKYIDGLAGSIRWHRGRCLSYGEGVTYWALAEMVRTRAAIVEGEDAPSALAKLHQALEESVPDAEERRWMEPRLAHLLGLEERVARDREELFSAWRLFYERLAEEMPTVMVFEDMQWADASLLDFIEYLLDWSRSHPLFVLTLARPELADRRPNWGSGRRNFTSLYLEPLSIGAMGELLAGLVPGLPEDPRGKILERAEGVPLYAMETVRMLLDRGVLIQEGAAYRPAGPIDALEIPETLHALIAARLDGLEPEERRLLQDAAVLGKTFSLPALARLSGLTEAEIEPLLSSLGRKEVLSIQSDPLSPERGQYGFLQDLVRRVAYETLSKRERKVRHLAVASYLESAWGKEEEEIVEVLASHYVQAYRAAPDAQDAGAIKDKAREMLARAGERAASLAASEEAQRYFEQAADMTDKPDAQAELLERAGVMARMGGRADESAAHFERSIALFESEGQTHPAARVSARLAEITWDRGRLKDAVDQMDRSFEILSRDVPDEDLASLAAQLGRLQFFSGDLDASAARIEVALDIAESLWVPEVLSQALNTKGIILMVRGRLREGHALLRYALDVATENDITSAALRAYYNLSELVSQSDRYQEAQQYIRDGLALARRIGNRPWEWLFLGQLYPALVLGEWDEALASAAELPTERIEEARGALLCLLGIVPLIHAQRGEIDKARQSHGLFPGAQGSADVQERSQFHSGLAAILAGEKRWAESLEAAEVALATREAVGTGLESFKEAFVSAVEASFALGDLDTVKRLLDMVGDLPRGRVSQYVVAHATRFGARLASVQGDLERPEGGFKQAIGMFRELGVPFWMGATLLEFAEWLTAQDRSGEAGPLVEEAGEIFERLGARPWLDRLTLLAAATAGAATSSAH